ncbi:MAG: serine O-acetyltransferase [Alphaproteobacteria bacterium]|nr:serine O-acetyltransferase [Alphaproteobacteria bacterium]
MFKTFREEISSIMARDPAARSWVEIVICYPGFHAVMFHRVSSWLWRRRVYLLARVLSQLARALTGIEIHPGAKIGSGFFVDHGMGVVVGETAELGKGVTLYHDVTLGGVSPAVESHSQRNQKRHPTLEDGVIVGSGAQILGPITVGEGARVGANAVVTKDVPPHATIVGIPGRAIVRVKAGASDEFAPYGTPLGDLPDPIARALEGLMDQVTSLKVRVEELETQVEDLDTSCPPASLVDNRESRNAGPKSR